MSVILERDPTLPGARRKITREDCRVLDKAGLLDWERHELIDGYLIRKLPKSPLDSVALLRLTEWLRGIFGPLHVQQGAAIVVGPDLSATNEPEPDAIVLRRPVTEFHTENPGPPDLLLVAEVCSTTQEYALGAKAALYASAGIAEYWVLDLRDMRIFVHREPMGERYGSILAYAADEAVAPLAAQSDSIRLCDLVS